jgi:hypothetical protein
MAKTNKERLDMLERLLLAQAGTEAPARATVAEMIYDTFSTHPDVPKIWTPSHNRIGPMNGKSSQVNLFIEGIDGRLAPVTVNVYSDGIIKSHLQEMLAAEAAEAEFAKQVRGG